VIRLPQVSDRLRLVGGRLVMRLPRALLRSVGVDSSVATPWCSFPGGELYWRGPANGWLAVREELQPDVLGVGRRAIRLFGPPRSVRPLNGQGPLPPFLSTGLWAGPASSVAVVRDVGRSRLVSASRILCPRASRLRSDVWR